ncbi:MAG: hypothetical protein WD623_02695 [Marinobacter sp.]|uniref:hypothetical protein n=1 Tax=Marinobacter sp. TaxID=50741 RepID=UPI0034A08F1A
MNRFAMLKQASHEIGIFVVVKILLTETQPDASIMSVILQSERGDILAFLTLSAGSGTQVPGLYQRLYALLLILRFGGRQYAFIEEHILLPDIA